MRKDFLKMCDRKTNLESLQSDYIHQFSYIKLDCILNNLPNLFFNPFDWKMIYFIINLGEDFVINHLSLFELE